MKPIIPRATARQDVDEAVDHYVDAADIDVPLRYVDALQQAFRAISLRPGSGSQRFGHELELPGLRSRMLKRFPYIVFYVEQPDHIDVCACYTRRGASLDGWRSFEGFLDRRDVASNVDGSRPMPVIHSLRAERLVLSVHTT